MKRIISSLFLTMLTVLILSSCNDGGKKIAIVNLMQHPVLDSVQVQTERYLTENGFNEENGYQIIDRNLNGQRDLLSTVTNEVISQNPELIIAITTPVAQSFVGKAEVPIVFSLVTDPVGAGIMDSLNQTKPLITGTSDVFPYEEQIKLIRTIHPNAESIGFVYDPGEAPAQYAYDELTRVAPLFDFNLVTRPATSTSEVPIAARSIINDVDILFVSSDNTAIDSVPTLVGLAIENKIPLYVGESGSVANGGIATVSVSYGSFGVETGKLAVQLLNGERNLPIYIPDEYELVVNTEAARRMGVSLPDSIIENASTVYNEIE